MSQHLGINTLRSEVRAALAERHNGVVEALAASHAPGEPIEAVLPSLLPVVGDLFGVTNPHDLAEVIDADLETREWAIEEGCLSGWTASEIIRRTDILEDVQANLREGLPADADRHALSQTALEEATFNLQALDARREDMASVISIKIRELCKFLSWDVPANGCDLFLKLEHEIGPESFRKIIEAFKPSVAAIKTSDWNPSFEELREDVLAVFSDLKVI